MDWREINRVVAEELSRGIGHGDKIRVNCPVCLLRTGKRDRKTSLVGHTSSGRYHCFKCGVTGRFAEALQNAPRVEDIKLFSQPEGYIPLWTMDAARSLSLQPALNYLRKRNVDRALLEQLQIGCCLVGRYAFSVIIPILLPQGDLGLWGGFVARTYVPSDTPYKYPPEMSRGGVFFNHEAVLEKTDKTLIVTEGVFDAIPYLPDSCAVLGKLSYNQINLLALAQRPVCLVLDGDAWEQAASAALWLRMQHQEAGFVKLPPRVDPDEVPVRELQQLADQSIHQPIKL